MSLYDHALQRRRKNTEIKKKTIKKNPKIYQNDIEQI